MGKSKKIIIIIVIVLVALYACFKIYGYLKYNTNESEVANVRFDGILTIDHIDLEEYEYLTFNNMKVRNVFDGYEPVDSDDTHFRMKKTEEDKTFAILMGSDEDFLTMTLNNNDFIKEFSNIVKRENIKSDIELLKYVEKHNDDKVSFFMSFSKQKEVYAINSFKEIMLPSLNGIKEINGYYTGYIFENNVIKEVNVLKDNKRYYVTFLGEYSDEFITDYLKTLVIE